MQKLFMVEERKKNKKLLVALILLLLVGFISSQGFLETSLYIKSHVLLKYGIYFIWMLIVASIGLWGWWHHPQQWVKKLWIIAYGVAIAILLILGLVDLFFGTIPLYFKKDISHFRAFFLSPAVLIILYLLSVFSKKQ